MSTNTDIITSTTDSATTSTPTTSEPKYTLLLFFPRNPTLSPSAFRSYYETHHAPMVRELAAQAPGLLTYKRRYIDHAGSAPSLQLPFTVFGEPAPTVPYDIVNEVTFETRAHAEAFAKLMYEDPANREKVVEDEERLFVRAGMRGMLVEVVE